MSSRRTDPLATKALAQVAVERAAQELQQIVHQLSTQLRPFPPFPGAFFTEAVEVEPDAAGSRERGCVVVCADGELYELVIGVEFETPEALLDPVASRTEELRKLELHPRDYIVYAYNAITALAEHLLEEKGGSG